MVAVKSDGGVIANARQMLSVWGLWQRTGSAVSFRLSYPHSSSFTHAGEINRERGVEGYVENRDAEKVERIMCWVKGFSPLVYQALECRYAEQRSIHSAVGKCRCSVATYQKRCSDGEHLIAGVLSGHVLKEPGSRPATHETTARPGHSSDQAGAD